MMSKEARQIMMSGQGEAGVRMWKVGPGAWHLIDPRAGCPRAALRRSHPRPGASCNRAIKSASALP
jgi:hypothetical protein